jgi:hypothetical protein
MNLHTGILLGRLLSQSASVAPPSEEEVARAKFVEEVESHAASFLEALERKVPLHLDSHEDFAYLERCLTKLLHKAEVFFLKIDSNEVAQPANLENDNGMLEYIVREINTRKFILRQIMEHCDIYKGQLVALVDESISTFVPAAKVMERAYSEIDFQLDSFEEALKETKTITIFYPNVRNLRRLLIQMTSKRIEVCLIDLIKKTKDLQLAEIDAKVCDGIVKQVFTDKYIVKARELVLDIIAYVSEERHIWVKIKNCNNNFANISLPLEAAQEEVKVEVDRIIRSIQILYSKDKSLSSVLVDFFAEPTTSIATTTTAATHSLSATLKDSANFTIFDSNSNNNSNNNSGSKDVDDDNDIDADSSKISSKTPKKSPLKVAKSPTTTGKRGRNKTDLVETEVAVVALSKKNRSVF